MAAPPFETGAVQETTDFRSSFDVPTTAVGAPGTVEGVAAAEAADATDAPLGFVAVTVKVYEVPLVRPVTVQVVSPVVLQVFAPGDEVTVYPVIAAPPLLGAVQDTIDCRFAFDEASTALGALGTVDGTAVADAEATELPLAFVAVTVNV
jgi:hypothetical protein